MAGDADESKSGLRTDGVQLLSILLAVSVSVGMTLGFNLSSWWIGVLSGVGTMTALTLWIRLATGDGLLARLARWILRE